MNTRSTGARIDTEVRIYLARDGERLIVLLGGGIKRGQQRDIDRAVELWQNDQRRRNAALKLNHPKRK